eukprot:8138532-Alexandrium_andersonii.AAC.1
MDQVDVNVANDAPASCQGRKSRDGQRNRPLVPRRNVDIANCPAPCARRASRPSALTSTSNRNVQAAPRDALKGLHHLVWSRD